MEIRTEQGRLTGKILQSRDGSDYYAYLGIPYAKPPVGELRFEPPQPTDPWEGVKCAIEFPERCIQKNYLFIGSGQNIKGSEDCLYLNVFTPVRQTSEQLPVILYVQGGYLAVGASHQVIPNYFMDHDVVIVTFQFRLHIFGFLSTGDDVVPGNNGLKDHVAALKWIQRNIAAFGGDPNLVTVYGTSAGAVCVNLLMYSPLCKGLFHRAICQSGAGFQFEMITPRQAARSQAQAIGVLAGFTGKSSKALVKHIKKLPAELLVLMFERFFLWQKEPNIPFSIVDEPDIPGAFITKFPWHHEQPLNPVPCLMGITSGEGIQKVLGFLSDDRNGLQELDKNFKYLFPLCTGYIYYLQYEDKISEITEAIRKFYFKDKQIGLETIQDLVDAFSDTIFNYSTLKAVLNNTDTTYLYYFDHKNEDSVTMLTAKNKNNLDFAGVCHADDLFSFFNLFSSANVNDKDIKVSKRLINYWINFARTGNPNNTDTLWKSVTGKNFEYLHITTDKDEMKCGLLHERYSFWKTILDPLLSSLLTQSLDYHIEPIRCSKL